MKRLMILFFCTISFRSYSQGIMGGLCTDFNSSYSNRQTYALGFDIEVQLGKEKSRFYLNFQQSFGINTISGSCHYFMHSCLGVREAIALMPNMDFTTREDNVTWLTLLLLPNGVTYYFPIKSVKSHRDNNQAIRSDFYYSDKLGFYLNPVSYQLWLLADKQKIDAYDLEFGLKYLKGLNDRTYLAFCAGTNFLASIGKKESLPPDYRNGFILNVKVGILWK